MIYTGGTTGRPKGVMLDHANLVATAAMIVDWFEMTAADRCLLVLPLFHVNGIMVSVVSPLVAGGSTVIAPRFDPKTFWDLVERVGPTYFSAVPTIYAMLTRLPPEVRPDTASLGARCAEPHRCPPRRFVRSRIATAFASSRDTANQRGRL